ncbi:MAG: Ppx/GppA family phosphatase [Myxococcales bacterium]|jgi:exopolyphosphatase/guanosine-5'-triphosphate,3'-diphosphate pyrophosphatase|nr:Ppx/GppA family phosphatase [Myxococcales bacterium]
MTDREASSAPTLPSAPVKAHVGVIDIGSNAIRLQVVRLFQDGGFRVIADERDPIRLGTEVFRSGMLSTQAMADALQTLARFSELARSHGAQELRSVGTSAMREAKNGQSFAREIETSIGLKVEVISGEREAQLIARGVLSGFQVPARKFVLADIGGGSTEISVVDRGHNRFGISLPLGSARLTERFCHSDPLSGADERALREFIRAELERSIPSALLPCPTLVGSAGTFGAVGNFIRRRVSTDSGKDARGNAISSRTKFSFLDLTRTCTCLCAMDLSARRSARGIEERRAEIIVAGALLLHELGQFFSVETFRGARRGLRDGLMLEELEKLGATLPKTAQRPPAAK